MFDFFDTFGLQSLTFQAIIFRLTLALICGATLVMMTGQFIFENIGGTDPSRLGAQIISGIGFLGAGTILVTGSQQVKGLTTAAALWASACMGIAIGIGFYAVAIATSVFVLIAMMPLDWLQTRFLAHSKYIQLFIILESFDSVNGFFVFCKEKNIHTSDFEVMNAPTGTGVAILVTMRFKKRMAHGEVIEMISTCPRPAFCGGNLKSAYSNGPAQNGRALFRIFAILIYMINPLDTKPFIMELTAAG